MRRDDKNVANEVTTMKVGGKRPRGRPRLRWSDLNAEYDRNVAKEVTTMKVGGKRPRGRPRLRWMDRKKMKEHQLEAKLAQDREAWRNAAMAIDPRKGSAKASNEQRV